MKRLLLSLMPLLTTAFASAATLSPIQLLNPAGSSTGQAIVSTGSSSAPAWGGIGVNGIAAIAANTVLANATGSSASPTAFAMPSCTSATNALGWNPAAGFNCNSAINAATLGGATFASPGAIGTTTPGSGAFTTLSASSAVSGSGFSTYLASPPAIGTTTPAAGKFTTLQATGAITPSTTAGIVGTTSGDSANPGSVGQILTNSSTGTSLSTGVISNCTSEPLTAGDWDVQGVITYVPAAGTTVSQLSAGISTTSATFATANTGATTFLVIGFTGGQTQVITTPVYQINVSSGTTAYLVGQPQFGTSTMTCNGFIRARRVR